MSQQLADAYGRAQVARFTSRVNLPKEHTDLLEALFSLAWHEGYCGGIKATAEKLNVVMAAVAEESQA